MLSKSLNHLLRLIPKFLEIESENRYFKICLTVPAQFKILENEIESRNIKTCLTTPAQFKFSEIESEIRNIKMLEQPAQFKFFRYCIQHVAAEK